MADYSYLAVDEKGKQVKGTVDAPDSRAAMNLVRDRGLTVIKVTEATVLNKEIKIEFHKKVKARDIGVFCRQMSSILDAGISITEALDILAEQTEKKQLREAVETTRDNVAKGELLSDAMRQAGDVFPSILISLVQTGEESGSIAHSFERMAVHFEKQAKLSGLVKKAMVYPAVILVVAFAAVMIMSIVVIPQFADLFDSMGAELPLITRAVMGFSHFVIHRWYILLVLIIAIVGGLKYYLSTDKGQHVWGRILLKIPVFGDLSAKNASADFARTMSTLMSAGMPVTRGLEITAAAMKNVLFRDVLLEVKKDVEQGQPMSNMLKETGIFPPMVGNMVRIGEEAGSVDAMLEKIADYYEDEVEMATEALTAVMEPLIIVVLGVIVGIIVLAIYMPMVSLYQNLDTL